MDEGEEALAELYTRQYEHHLRETQAHISGQISEPHTSQVTFLPPGSFWTPTEKALFFHALSVHSRLRPDLVASCIPTKNVVEVCALIDLFDQEVAVQAEATIERDALPISYDISDAFLALEVEQAIILTGREIPCNVSEEPGPVKNVLQRLEQAHLSVLDSMLKNYGMEKQGPEDKEPNAGALSTSPPRSASPALDPDVLSPASKRRYQKRIYMRQRRAEASGTAVNTSIAKLRVGRARKERLPRKPRPTKYNICQKSAELIYDSDEIMDDGDQSDRSIEALFQPSQQREKLLTSVAHKNLGGKTKYQKARDLIGAAGLEVQDIQDYGLDLFYLSRIGKRIVTFGKREGDLAATAIDVQVLTLLRTIVTEFVVEVMERALLLREQELQMKEDTRAWRISDIDEIPRGSIDQALWMLGFPLPFETVVHEVDEMSSDEDNLSSRHSTPSSSYIGANPEIDTAGLSSAGLNSTMPPLLPCSLELSQPLFRLPMNIMRALTSESAQITTEADDDTQLAAELMAEHALDKYDRKLAKQYENGLCRDLGVPIQTKVKIATPPPKVSEA